MRGEDVDDRNSGDPEQGLDVGRPELLSAARLRRLCGDERVVQESREQVLIDPAAAREAAPEIGRLLSSRQVGGQEK